jgi:hypothetical protein
MVYQVYIRAFLKFKPAPSLLTGTLFVDRVRMQIWLLARSRSEYRTLG